MRQVYLHGLGQTPASWDKVAAQLSSDGSRVCLDLAAMLHGAEATYENLYAGFSEICGNDEGPVNLCGLSLGGVLALNYALDYPEKVNSLVLIAAQYKMPKALLRVQNAVFRFMPEAMFRQTGFKKPEFLRLCRTMMKLDFSARLETISCPVLIVYGEKDSANRRASVEMAERIKNAELRIIKESGHEVNLDAPEQLAEVLQEFYARIG